MSNQPEEALQPKLLELKQLEPKAPDSATASAPFDPPVERPARNVSRSAFGLLTRLRDEARRFPVVVALTAVASLISVIFVFDLMSHDALSTWLNNLCMACILGTCGAVSAQLAAERRGLDERRARFLQLVGGLALVVVAMASFRIGDITSREYLATLWRFGLTGARLCMVPWLIMDDDNQSTLMPKLTSATLLTGGLILALFLGLCICIVAAEALLFGSLSALDDLYEIAAIACWIFLAPNLFCAQLPHMHERPQVSRAFHALVGYVVFPLCLLLLAVLYGYIGRVIITWTIPSGEMNWFGSFALLVWVFLWMELRDMTWPPARWFVRWGWLLLVPVVAVQLVGVFIRLRAYGLTELRVASLACTGVGIFALVWAALGRGPRMVFAVMAAVLLAVTVGPTNVVDLANLSQTRRLHRALEEVDLVGEDGLVKANPHVANASDEQVQQIASAWDYLRSTDRGYLSDRLVDDLRTREGDKNVYELFGIPHAEGSDDGYVSHYGMPEFLSDAAGVDVAGHARLYDLDAASYSGRNATVTSDNWVLRARWDDGTSLEVDLKDALADLTTYAQANGFDLRSYDELTIPADMLRIPCADGRILALTRVRLETNDGKVTEAALEGYLLVP